MAKFRLALEDDSEGDSNYETEKNIEAELSEEEAAPVVGELAVDKVYEEQVNPEEAIEAVNSVDEEETRQDAVSDAIESTTELTAVAEALIEAINSKGGFDSTAAKLAMLSLKSNRKKLGFKNTKSFSLENHSDNIKSSSKLALEGIMDTLKQVWDVICKTISKSIAWISNFFKQLIFGVKNDVDFIRKTGNDLLKNRKDNSDKLEQETKFGFDKKNFVTDPQIASKLTVGGKPVDSYKDEFTNILYLLNPSKFRSSFGKNPFEKNFNDDFIKQLKEYIVTELKEGNSSKNKIDFFPEQFFINLCNKTDQLDGPSSFSENGVAAKENHMYLTQHPLLGGFYLIHEVHNDDINQVVKSNLEKLQNISNWNIQVAFNNTDKESNGWLRYLDSKEIEETSTVVLEVLAEVEDFDRNIDKLTKFQNSLNQIASDARQYNFNISTVEGQNKITIANVTIAAMGNIIKVLNNTSFKYVQYARSECNAWGLYLNMILQKEKQLVSK